jgi:hypothetical protein
VIAVVEQPLFAAGALEKLVRNAPTPNTQFGVYTYPLPVAVAAQLGVASAASVSAAGEAAAGEPQVVPLGLGTPQPQEGLIDDGLFVVMAVRLARYHSNMFSAHAIVEVVVE